MSLHVYTIKTLISKFPAVIPSLKGKARWIAFAFVLGERKTVEYFDRELTRMVTNVYNGDLGGQFIDIMASLIQGQITQAYEQAWRDDGNELPLPDYLANAAEEAILNQYDFVDQFYRDIVDARIDETPLDALLARVDMWANRWQEAYNNAVALMAIENGDKLIWVYGDTEHCDTCNRLNGIVAYASDWDELGVHPQQAPNEHLDCGGWRCGCSLEVTSARRTPNAKQRISEIIG